MGNCVYFGTHTFHIDGCYVNCGDDKFRDLLDEVNNDSELSQFMSSYSRQDQPTNSVNLPVEMESGGSRKLMNRLRFWSKIKQIGKTSWYDHFVTQLILLGVRSRSVPNPSSIATFSIGIVSALILSGVIKQRRDLDTLFDTLKDYVHLAHNRGNEIPINHFSSVHESDDRFSETCSELLRLEEFEELKIKDNRGSRELLIAGPGDAVSNFRDFLLRRFQGEIICTPPKQTLAAHINLLPVSGLATKLSSINFYPPNIEIVTPQGLQITGSNFDALAMGEIIVASLEDPIQSKLVLDNATRQSDQIFVVGTRTTMKAINWYKPFTQKPIRLF